MSTINWHGTILPHIIYELSIYSYLSNGSTDIARALHVFQSNFYEQILEIQFIFKLQLNIISSDALGWYISHGKLQYLETTASKYIKIRIHHYFSPTFFDFRYIPRYEYILFIDFMLRIFFIDWKNHNRDALGVNHKQYASFCHEKPHIRDGIRTEERGSAITYTILIDKLCTRYRHTNFLRG